MATSGTYSFMMSRDDLIGAVFRLMGVFGIGDTIPPQHIANAAQALNIVAKELATAGLPLWCVQDVAVPMVAGQATYNLSLATGQTLPLRILDAYLRDSTGNDVTNLLVSRYDYDTLGQKTSQGSPNQLFYDPQLTGGILTLYNVPADATHTLHVVIQRQIQDFNLATDNPDFPQESYRMLKWVLADELSMEYAVTPDMRREISAKASSIKDRFFDYEQEQVSVYFTPSERMRY